MKMNMSEKLHIGMATVSAIGSSVLLHASKEMYRVADQTEGVSASIQMMDAAGRDLFLSVGFAGASAIFVASALASRASRKEHQETEAGGSGAQ